MKKIFSLLLSVSMTGIQPALLWAGALPLESGGGLSTSTASAFPLGPALGLMKSSQDGLKDLSSRNFSAMPLDELRMAAGRLMGERSDGEPLTEPAVSAALAQDDEVGRQADAAAAQEKNEGTVDREPPSPSFPWPGQEKKKAFFVRFPLVPRLLLSPVAKALYNIDVHGLENLPQGPAIVVANHVTNVDALLLLLATKKPLRFWMNRHIYETHALKGIFKALGVIAIHPADSPGQIEQAMTETLEALKNGETVVIFPEGVMTRHGNMVRFKRGFEKLAEQAGVPVIPAHLDGLWGGLFSEKIKGSSLWSHLRGLPRPVTVRFGKALESPDPQNAREAVQVLGAVSMEGRIRRSGKTLPRAFLGSAKKFWSRKAVADSTGLELTYGRALTGAVLLADALKSQISGANVGVLLPPSAGGALANLALSNLGKVPVNLNYTAGREVMAHAIEKAEITSIVTSRKFLQALKERGLPEPSGKLVLLEDINIPSWKKAATYAALRVLPRPVVEALFLRPAAKSLDDNATILFTSGSSAMPKGVELTHANIRANIEMVREVFPSAQRQAVLGVLPFFHSFGYTMTLWYTLLSGFSAAYHVNPLDTAAIAKLAARHQPTLLLAPPTFLQLYAKSKSIPPEAFASLKFVVAGAEKLRSEVAAQFEEKFGTRPYEGYGATELSPVASGNLPDAGKQKGNKEGTVGHPLPGSAMRVVDPETFKPLPWGRQGLLLVKGPHVMKGYLKDPAKTKEAIKDGWYVSGDIAVMDKDGFVTMKGRQSRFSKIGGEMVSHVAVEEKLQRAAGVTEQTFVVTAVADAAKGERLVVLYAGYEGSIDALLEKARTEGLPQLWMPKPKDFHKIEKLPLLGSGKLDLKAIKELAAKLTGGQA